MMDWFLDMPLPASLNYKVCHLAGFEFLVGETWCIECVKGNAVKCHNHRNQDRSKGHGIREAILRTPYIMCGNEMTMIY